MAAGPREKYGLAWGPEWTDTQIELECMIHNHPESAGGLGKLGHLRNAMMLLWPHLYAGEEEPGFPRWREEIEMLAWAFCTYRVVFVVGHASAAKCLGKGTEVLLYSGDVIPVEDVRPGMRLMGDDSTPRRVLSVARGREPLYRVVPSRGDPWVCNESHILSLKAAYVPRKNSFKRGDVRDVPLKEFLGYGQTRRRVWKQYRVGVEFPPAGPLEVAPYIYGLWLGDGDTRAPILSQVQNAAAEEWVRYWESRGARIWSSDKGTVPRWAVRFDRVGRGAENPFTRFLRGSVDKLGKRIRREYLTASRDARLELLAGIIDTDGTADKSGFAITTTLRGLAEDYRFLARSLGFGSEIRERNAEIKQTGFRGKCYRVSVFGDVEQIPTRLKKPRSFRTCRDPLLQEIVRVEPLGEGDYYGFTIDGNHRFLLGDFTVTHNTHTFAHMLAACYLASPFDSIVTLTSTHLPGLRKRFWAETISALHGNTATSALDWHVRGHDLTVRPAMNAREDKYVIEGIAVDRGEEAVEKIQGNHSRHHRYIAIDEAQGTPKAIFDAAANLMSDRDFHMAGLMNPTKKYSEAGSWCEPKNGWNSVDPDIDIWWETARGGVCVRLDGKRSPNIKAGRTIFPFLITLDYERQVVNSYGEGSPRWWIYVRGWFPPDGMTGTIFLQAIIERARERIEFDERPKKAAALDPAFEGGDECVLQIAEYGRARGSNFAMNLLKDIVVKVKVEDGGDPLDWLIAKRVMEICKEENVSPEDFIMDTTGAGRGVAAFLMKEWDPRIHRCSFGQGPSDRPLKVGEPDTCKELFDRFVSELWWSARAFMEEGMIGNLGATEFLVVREQLAAREYESVKDKKISIETKREMRKRVGYSPDHADAFVLFTELFKRKGARAGNVNNKLIVTRDTLSMKRAVRYSKIATETFANAAV